MNRKVAVIVKKTLMVLTAIIIAVAVYVLASLYGDMVSFYVMAVLTISFGAIIIYDMLKGRYHEN